LLVALSWAETSDKRFFGRVCLCLPLVNPCDRTQKAEGCVASIFFAIYSVNFREIDKNFISFV
jgi:hypothetical protein